MDSEGQPGQHQAAMWATMGGGEKVRGRREGVELPGGERAQGTRVGHGGGDER